MGGSRGVLCHLTSLPESNIQNIKNFISLLSKNNINSWQMLPITPPDQHGSPYSSPSAFAGWDELVKGEKLNDIQNEEYWLDDWALFRTIKSYHDDLPWTQWPPELRDRDPSALGEWRNKAEYDYEINIQKSFQSGWIEIHEYAKENNVSLIGDLPIFIAHDSADVWAHRELFQLDDAGMPVVVAGVPPDYFSEDGQKWGTVLYNWDSHREESWRWWKERMARMMRLFDVVRVDHFRGFHSAWAIPAEDENARNGVWQEGPKSEILKILIGVAGSESRIIAEDLGIIPPEVIALRKENNLDGMAVIQFGFDGNLETNPHYPSNISTNQIVYTGTHDNDTTLGWWNKSDEGRKIRLKQLLDDSEDIVEGCIRLAIECDSKLAIVPLQDILGLDSNCRMNTPGTSINNWNWQFSWNDLTENRLQWFGSL
ncbi:MAG: 4-alpha-glucanotransferase [Candidatus Poseidoniaceae archaeon]|nr:4-alpha-glucanotransferase [Candidatus Poseidoniaceae archaeon]